MEITLATPALLFPAISLVMLAYTNRFLALATLIRQLLDAYAREHDQNLLAQIASLRLRVRLVLWMQAIGAASFSFCVAAMLTLLLHWSVLGIWLFGASLLLLLLSLLLSMLEIRLSANALDLALREIQ
jgi:hypothetical protein